MGTIRKTAEGFRAEVRHRTPDGLFYRSSVFDKKQQAQVWMGRTEEEFRLGLARASSKTLGDALGRYGREVSPTHRGERWEALRLAAWARSKLGALALDKLSPDDLGAWRDERLAVVSAGTVRREFALLSGVLETARREWRWLAVNPAKDVRKPPAPQARSRRVAEAEERAMLKALGHEPGRRPAKLTQEVAVAFLLSLETGMRASEIVGLEWDRVHLDRRFLTLAVTKNGRSRDVPLTKTAVEILQTMEPGDGMVFGLTPAMLDALWRKTRDRATRDLPSLSTLHFHDARAEALTRLARRVDVLTLSKISGHLDLKMLSRVYYRESAEDIAARL